MEGEGAGEQREVEEGDGRGWMENGEAAERDRREGREEGGREKGREGCTSASTSS